MATHKKKTQKEQEQSAKPQELQGAESTPQIDPKTSIVSVKHQITQTLIEAMKNNAAPWQKPWKAVPVRPINLATQNRYKGINFHMLALAGRSDPRWMTYQQAQEKGWHVKKGERGCMVVKVVDLSYLNDEQAKKSHKPAQLEGQEQEAPKYALKRYFVFNAEQIEGAPPLDPQEATVEAQPSRALDIIEALKEKTGLTVLHQGDRAFYSPSRDQIVMPPKKTFLTEYDYFATILHEAAHATLHEKRMDRQDAIAKKWGNEAYAVEELRAEMTSVILASETGIAASSSKEHLVNHAAYLNSWISCCQKDPMVIFSAAKDAELMAGYLLGLEATKKQEAALAAAMEPHKEWIKEYEVMCKI